VPPAAHPVHPLRCHMCATHSLLFFSSFSLPRWPPLDGSGALLPAPASCVRPAFPLLLLLLQPSSLFSILLCIRPFRWQAPTYDAAPHRRSYPLVFAVNSLPGVSSPPQMAGSDLDGDIYFLSWDVRLLPPAHNRNRPAMDYSAVPPKEVDQVGSRVGLPLSGPASERTCRLACANCAGRQMCLPAQLLQCMRHERSDSQAKELKLEGRMHQAAANGGRC